MTDVSCKSVLSPLEEKKEEKKDEKEHKIDSAIEKHTESSKEYIGKRSEEFFESMRERKLNSIDFWKNAMRDSPEKEKVLEEKKVDGKGVRDCMFSLSAKEKENEKIKRCRPKRNFLAAPLLSSTNPEPDDTPPRTLGDARKCKFWNGFEKAIESELYMGIHRSKFLPPKHKHLESEICVRYQERGREGISKIQSENGCVWVHTSRRS